MWFIPIHPSGKSLEPTCQSRKIPVGWGGCGWGFMVQQVWGGEVGWLGNISCPIWDVNSKSSPNKSDGFLEDEYTFLLLSYDHHFGSFLRTQLYQQYQPHFSPMKNTAFLCSRCGNPLHPPWFQRDGWLSTESGIPSGGTCDFRRAVDGSSTMRNSAFFFAVNIHIV